MEATEGARSGSRSRAVRLLTEAVVLVFSILLAFSIDAWWDNRGDRNAELMLLTRLKADFSEIQTMLEMNTKDHVATRDACLSLLDYSVGESLPVTPDVDFMVAQVFLASRTFNPGAGAVDTFLNSDGARLIDNDELADLLLAWPGLVEEVQEEEVSLQKGVSERWTPYLASKTNLGPYVASYRELLPELPAHIASPAQRSPISVDQEFLNHVLNRLIWQQLVLRDSKPLEVALQKIVTVLDDELATVNAERSRLL